jgi:sugar lactone lactonase YvrE
MGTLVAGWGIGGKGKGQIPFNNPLGVAVDSANNLYVVSSSVSAVNKYDNGGNLVAQFLTANGVAFSGPQGVAVDKFNNVYVNDTGNSRIVELSSAGSPVSTFNSNGMISLAVTLSGIAVDSNGNVAVAAGDNKVRFYNSAGSLLATLIGFSNPNGLAFDSGNNLYVADTGVPEIEEFFMGNYVSPNFMFNGGVSLGAPKGIAVDGSGNLYVADYNNNSVYKFFP